MALIHCGECRAQISSEATACPKCGCPTSKAFDPPTANAPVITIQATSKGYKAAQFLGVMLILAGVVSCVGNPEASSTAWLFIAGFTLYAAGRIGAWWHHG